MEGVLLLEANTALVSDRAIVYDSLTSHSRGYRYHYFAVASALQPFTQHAQNNFCCFATISQLVGVPYGAIIYARAPTEDAALSTDRRALNYRIPTTT